MTQEQPDQSTKTTSQKYTININQLYEDWIGPIDAIRSYASVRNSTFKSLAGDGLNDAALVKFTKTIKTESTLQESRCHAFYRWIGFPVVDEGGSIYSPGFDIISCATGHVGIFQKMAIAKNPKAGFEFLSNARENFIRDNTKIFLNPYSIAASTMALSSGGTDKLRSFAAPFKDGDDPFDMVVLNQTNTPDLSGHVGGHPVYLTEYKDAGGIKSSDSDIKPIFNRPHIIKPFIVDARIDFSVTPQSRLVAVPFVPDDSHLKASSTESVRRPLIEKFIRDRSPLKNPIAAPGDNVNAILDYINRSTTITDKELISKIQKRDNLFKSQNEQIQFIDSLDIIKAMVNELVYAEDVIRAAQGLYYWVPYPSTIGPEGGSKVQGVFIPTYISSENDKQLITDKDSAIIDAHSKSATNNINTDSAELTGSPGALNYGISATSSINISSATTSGLGDNNAKNEETISRIRFRELTAASEALRVVEIIMGEFSGLGLCDIVAITTALKILPIENLCGLLDKQAFDRMKIALPSLSKTIQADFIPSMTIFTGLVKDFYNIMDSIYTETRHGKK